MLKPLANRLISLTATTATALSIFAMGSVVTSTTAHAASCWNHNNSVVRLTASGNYREFRYWNPRSVLRRAGVRRGTLLFNGNKNGNWYSGTARRFSKFCPSAPLEYSVEGPVASSQTRVTVRGSRQVYKQCKPTGRWVKDTLVFTYLRQC